MLMESPASSMAGTPDMLVEKPPLQRCLLAQLEARATEVVNLEEGPSRRASRDSATDSVSAVGGTLTSCMDLDDLAVLIFSHLSLESVAAAALFFTLGQVCMILFSVLFQLLTPYDDQAEARKGNAAAGIRFASNLIALALLTSTPLKKSEEVATFFLFFGLAAIFLFLFGQLLDRLILPGNINKEIEDDRNWGMPLISGVILIVTAFMLDTLLPDIPCPGTPARNAYEAYFRQLP